MEGTTTPELIRRLNDAATDLHRAWSDGRAEEAREAARQVLSLGSKIHQRLGVLVDIDREARWRAEVDRAIKSQPKQLPGQVSIDDALKDAKPTRKPRSRGK